MCFEHKLAALVAATANDNHPRRRGFPISPEMVAAHWADEIVNRFGDTITLTVNESVMLRHGEMFAPERYCPDADELAELGVDVIALAICIESGLIDRTEFGGYIRRLRKGDAGTVADLNALLAHHVETNGEAGSNRDNLDRLLAATHAANRLEDAATAA